LIDPRWENFYVESERSPLVTFKHSPQAEADMVEWFERLRRLNGGRTPRGAGFGALRQIGEAFARLSPEQITALARDYQLTYLLTPAGRLPFPKLFKHRGLHLYRIDGAPP
jgi:hypothetical protein